MESVCGIAQSEKSHNVRLRAPACMFHSLIYSIHNVPVFCEIFYECRRRWLLHSTSSLLSWPLSSSSLNSPVSLAFRHSWTKQRCSSPVTPCSYRPITATGTFNPVKIKSAKSITTLPLMVNGRRSPTLVHRPTAWNALPDYLRDNSCR